MSRISIGVLTVLLPVVLAACDDDSNPVGPSGLSSTTRQPAQPTTSSPVVSGQPSVTLPAPAPLPMPNVTPTEPGLPDGGQFTVSK